MGRGFTTLEVGDPQGRNLQTVQAEVDAGSTHTTQPRKLLQDPGIPVTRTVPSRLADGTKKPVQVGYASIRLAGAELIPTVIFDEEGEPSLLGMITLEDALLAVDPVSNQLVPVVARRYWNGMSMIILRLPTVTGGRRQPVGGRSTGIRRRRRQSVSPCFTYVGRGESAQ